MKRLILALFIIKRYYASRQCIQAYNANDYYVYILF
jgi:hypothetical protein